MKFGFTAGLLLVTTTFFAQTFTEAYSVSPFEAVGNSSIAFADVDGDTDQDLLITGWDDSRNVTNLYINDGKGIFTKKTPVPFERVRLGSVAFADVDGDNDQDVLITGWGLSQISKLYINEGTGEFKTLLGTPFEGVYRSSVAFADVDGDNDLDVLITGSSRNGPSSKLYFNDGSGTFTLATGATFEPVERSSVAFADVDGDHDQDLLITGWQYNESIINLYTNDGEGNFTERTGTPFEPVQMGSIAFVDVDGDSDQDVFITGRPSATTIISKLYTNDGDGNFTEKPGTSFEPASSSSISFADVDSDNDLDVLITGRSGASLISKLYTNDGEGNFSELTGTPFEGVESSAVAFADVDGDNDQDVLITGFATSGPFSKLYANGEAISASSDVLNKSDFDLVLFPNPIKSKQLPVRFESTENGEVMVQVFDSNGRVVSQKIERVGYGAQNIEVDISSLTSGIYFIQIAMHQRKSVTKFVIE